MTSRFGYAIRKRISEVLREHTLEESVERLALVGFQTSIETVRRYREGLAKRIDVEFVAAATEAFGADPEWLLRGGVPGESSAACNWPRMQETLRQVALSSAWGLIGPARETQEDEDLRVLATLAFFEELNDRLGFGREAVWLRGAEEAQEAVARRDARRDE